MNSVRVFLNRIICLCCAVCLTSLKYDDSVLNNSIYPTSFNRTKRNLSDLLSFFFCLTVVHPLASTVSFLSNFYLYRSKLHLSRMWYISMKINSQLFVFAFINLGFNIDSSACLLWRQRLCSVALSFFFLYRSPSIFLFLFIQLYEASFGRDDTQANIINLITMWFSGLRIKQTLCTLLILWTINGYLYHKSTHT